MSIIELETDRMILRQWCKDDLALFAQMNSDTELMRYFPSVLSEQQSNELADKVISDIDKKGWGLWAVELKNTKAFIGYVGLSEITFSPPFTTLEDPAVEIAWRLQRSVWGLGYAPEAAKAALIFAFSVLELKEIISFTTLHNTASQSVMRKVGLRESCQFDHPHLPNGHELSRHVLYRLAPE